MICSMMQLMKSSCKKKKITVQYETHDKIIDEIDEYELYEIDKINLDEKK